MAASQVFMVRPANFGFNAATAASNVFQNKVAAKTKHYQLKVEQEFEAAVKTLQGLGIVVDVFEDSKEHTNPDAIFPNNWLSTHSDGKLVLYPMLAENRRTERQPNIVWFMEDHFAVSKIIDLTRFEKQGKYLEGTGSLVFDHKNKIAYACISERTNTQMVAQICKQLKYQPICFDALDETGIPIYHTNVMMCIADEFAVVCDVSIKDKAQRAIVVGSLKNMDKQVISITYAQMKAFAGNMLELQNKKGENVLVMSQSAFDVLNTSQKNKLKKFAQIAPINIPTIEKIGGGSIRCMIGENFLPSINPIP